MTRTLKLHEITHSPNNVKVRIGLGYKGLEYERQALQIREYPGDRSAIVARSRQPRLPLLEHGEIAIFDSGAILRYLEANFADTPPLFSSDYMEFADIERWELFSRRELGEPVGMMFRHVIGVDRDPGVPERARALMNERCAALEEALADSPFLVGDHLTAADIACAAVAQLAAIPAQATGQGPLRERFRDLFQLSEERPRTRAWIHSIVSFDEEYHASLQASSPAS